MRKVDFSIQMPNPNTKKKTQIALVASAGGHLTQLLQLRPAWKGQSVFFVTTTEVGRSKLAAEGTVYVLGECNRQQPFKILRVFVRCIKILLQERPGMILSTGAAVGFLMCFFGKLMGAKVIWVDSIANANKLSMSGRMIRPFANLILCQWPDVAAQYAKVQYVGEVI